MLFIILQLVCANAPRLLIVYVIIKSITTGLFDLLFLQVEWEKYFTECTAENLGNLLFLSILFYFNLLFLNNN